MAFEVFSEIFVRDDDAADISLIVGSEARRSLFEVQLVGRNFRSEVKLSREFGLDDGPVTITLQGVFKRDGGTAKAQVRIPSFGMIEGIRVSQASADYIEARVSHRERLHTSLPPYYYGSAPRSAAMDQCTVTCPNTGESRSGKSACIECKCKRGTVKICC